MLEVYLLPSKCVAGAGVKSSPSGQRGQISAPSLLIVDRDPGVQGPSCQVVIHSPSDDDLIIVWIWDGAGKRCGVSQGKTLLHRAIGQNLLRCFLSAIPSSDDVEASVSGPGHVLGSPAAEAEGGRGPGA